MSCPSCARQLPLGAPRCWSCGRLIDDGSGSFWGSPIIRVIALGIVLGIAFGVALFAFVPVRHETVIAAAAPVVSPAAAGTTTLASTSPVSSPTPNPTTAPTPDPTIAPATAPTLTPAPDPTPAPTRAPAPTPVASPPTPVASPPTPNDTNSAPVSDSVALVPLPALSINVAYSTVSYFAIEGTTPNELLASAKASNHSRGHDAIAYVTPTTSIDYTALTNPDSGGCEVSSFAVSRTYQVTAPRWTAPAAVHPELLAWWQSILGQVARHEEQHVLIFERHFIAMESQALGATCDELQSIMDSQTALMKAEQEAFDVAERNWQPPPYNGPLY